MSKIQIHRELCDQLHGTYKTKNNDYGDSFAMVRKKFPNSILIRLNDKLNRLETLMSGTQQMVPDESIDDTLLDLSNYALMELTERRAERVGYGVQLGTHKPAECEYLQAGRCLGQKNMPECDSSPAVCDVRKGDV